MAKRPRRRQRLRNLVRNFKENGIKFLLEHQGNVRELFQIVASSWAEEIDFDKMTWIKTTFIRRDFRHAESDVILTAPWRGKRGKRARRSLLIYILIEHQSEPDRLMPLRLLDYIVQSFNYQLRLWSRTHDSLKNARIAPVLPFVLYTGTRRWPSIGTMATLLEHGSEFRQVTPILEQPLYLNLPELAASALEEGGYFGSVLRLFQQRRANFKEFRELLEDVVRKLETMPDAERLRWLDMLSYVHALIYYERERNESAPLQEVLEDSVAADEHRQEIIEMGKSYAEELIEEGMEKGALRSKREMLKKQLQVRFGRLPRATRKAIDGTTDSRQLETWIERFAAATSLEEVGIE